LGLTSKFDLASTHSTKNFNRPIIKLPSLVACSVVVSTFEGHESCFILLFPVQISMSQLRSPKDELSEFPNWKEF
jgi:hypothetical protein